MDKGGSAIARLKPGVCRNDRTKVVQLSLGEDDLVGVI
jgi:hypothetical protein